MATVDARSRLAALGGSTRGAGMVEYIVIVAVVALAAIAGYRAFGGALEQKATDEGQHVTSLSAYNGTTRSTPPGTPPASTTPAPSTTTASATPPPAPAT